ncbi:MAG: SMI1/KNR4 family protein [Planctomycetia bacterium]|nr:SMI1/KNR4 family protein [Planctomycetia bacterium]
MNTPFKQLQNLLPPPEQATFSHGDWLGVEEMLHTPLPDEYKDFVARYGAGVVLPPNIWVYNPFFATPDVMAICEQHENLVDESDSRVDFFPMQGGLLPWGASDLGHYFFWVTEGKPSDWYVAVTMNCEEIWRFQGQGMVRFLVELFSQQSAAFPALFSKEDFASPITFQPHLNAPKPLRLFQLRTLVRDHLSVTYQIGDFLSAKLPPEWTLSVGREVGGAALPPYSHVFSSNWRVPGERQDLVPRYEASLYREASLLITSDDAIAQFATSLHRTWQSALMHAQSVPEETRNSLLRYRRYRIDEQGVLLHDGSRVPWLLYSEYEDSRRLAYFWVHGGFRWMLQCQTSAIDLSQGRLYFDAIASSIRFL